MAAVGEEDLDYESDPEEVKRSLAMRRRAAASDDEEGEAEEKPGADPIGSDESDDQGCAAEEYDEDGDYEEELEDEEVEIYEEEEEEEEVAIVDTYDESQSGVVVVVAETKELEGGGGGDVRTGDEEEAAEENGENEGGEDVEKKENEPFVVPTAGAFYMHDDRYRDNAGGGRGRRLHGGRKLWESKDDRKWGHDKFEEMSMHERHHQEGRKPSRGGFVGRGRNRGTGRGYARGNRSNEYENNNQRQVPKNVRGRGPSRYEPAAFRNSRQVPSTQNRQSGKSVEKSQKTSQSNSERTLAPNSNAESDPVPATKNVFASSLNSASPPFYPSGSSTKDINLNQKRDVHAGSAKRNARSSVTEEGLTGRQSNALSRGKNVAQSVGVGVEKLYIGDSNNSATGKAFMPVQRPTSGSSIVNASQVPQSRVQGRGVVPGQMSYRPVVPQNQMTRAPSMQYQAVQRNPGSAKRNARSSVKEEGLTGRQSDALSRGKNVAQSVGVGVEKLYIDDSNNSATGKAFMPVQRPTSESSIVNASQAPQSRVQGRGVAPGQMSYRPVLPQNQMTRAPSMQYHSVQHNPVQNRPQQALQAPAPQLGQRPGSGSQASSPPKTPGEVEPSDSSNFTGALVAKGKNSTQGSGRGAVTFNGAQVMGPTGAMVVNHGDQNFPGTPAFLPVMQFGGQHPGGMGVPAVGMAYPGYVAQPQPQHGGGLGNSEMAWLPLLAGAAGALGATYPPYLTVDGAYHARPSGQTSSIVPLSKENNANKTNNELKPETVGDEYGQRQNKPRRYSQMNVASEVLQNNTELV